MFNSPKRVLLLSAHTDDCEIGMGGTIDRLAEAGCEFHWLTFCNAWQSLPKGFDKETLLREQAKTAEHFGLPQGALTMADIHVRKFPEFRQDILEELVRVGRDFRPDTIFCPSLQDNHQDHNTLALEARRAFKRQSIFGYILPWNIQTEIRQCHVEISRKNLDRKVAAVDMYDSQKHRGYMGREEIEALARSSGISGGLTYAETFEVIKLCAPITA